MNIMKKREEFDKKSSKIIEKFLNIFSLIEEVIIELDNENVIKDISLQCFDMFGFNPDEMIGKNLFTFIHPNDLDKVKYKYKEKFEFEKIILMEYRFLHKNNYFIPVMAKGKVMISNDEPNSILLLVRCKNIEQNKNKERSLFENYLNLAGVIMVALDRNGIITLMNKKGYEVLEYEEGELIGKNWFDTCLPGRLKKQVYEVFKRLIRGEIKILEFYENLINSKNNKEKIIAWHNTVLYNDDGNIIGTLSSGEDITEKKKADERLKDSEEKFRTITNQSLMGIAILQNDVVKYANQAFYDIFEYDVEDLKIWSPGELYKLIHPEDREYVIEQASKKQRGRSDYNSYYKFRCIKKSGEIIYLEIFSKTFSYKGQTADLITVIDITEKIKIERRLLESEEKFRRIAEQSATGIIIIQDNKVKYVNQKLEEMISYSKKELINFQPEKIFNLIEPDYRDDVIEILKRNESGSGDTETHIRFKIFKKNLEPIWVDTYTKSIIYEDRQAAMSIYIDITDKIIAEEKLNEKQATLESIFRAAPTGIGMVIDRIFTQVNDRFCKLVGYSCDELLGKNARIVYPNDEEYEYIGKEKYKQINEKGVGTVETKFKRKDGKIIDVLLSSVPINQNDLSEGVTFTALDITERKKAELELKKLNNLKSILLTRASHELKTPLMAIKGFTDLLSIKFKDSLHEEELKMVNEIKKGCYRLEKLTDDILKTAYLETGSVKLRKSKEDLVFLIRACVEELKSLFNSRNHTINLNLHEKIITEFEKGQIYQAVNNILTNAIKYTPPNGKIEINSDVQNNKVIISIKDSGIGITEKQKEQLFKRFGKIERFGQGYDVITEGSGLGLYLSKKIIELHGGEIWVESEGSHKGSTFYFSIPIID